MEELCDLSVKELMDIVRDEKECGKCSECSARRDRGLKHNGEGVYCDEAAQYALEIAYEKLEKAEELARARENSVKDEESSTELKSLTEPFYQQTVDFMKKSGYTHCYMCGSQLK